MALAQQVSQYLANTLIINETIGSCFRQVRWNIQRFFYGFGLYRFKQLACIREDKSSGCRNSLALLRQPGPTPGDHLPARDSSPTSSLERTYGGLSGWTTSSWMASDIRIRWKRCPELMSQYRPCWAIFRSFQTAGNSVKRSEPAPPTSPGSWSDSLWEITVVPIFFCGAGKGFNGRKDVPGKNKGWISKQYKASSPPREGIGLLRCKIDG